MIVIIYLLLKIEIYLFAEAVIWLAWKEDCNLSFISIFFFCGKKLSHSLNGRMESVKAFRMPFASFPTCVANNEYTHIVCTVHVRTHTHTYTQLHQWAPVTMATTFYVWVSEFNKKDKKKSPSIVASQLFHNELVRPTKLQVRSCAHQTH